MAVILTRSIDLSMAANLAFTGMVGRHDQRRLSRRSDPAADRSSRWPSAWRSARINGLLVWKLDIPSIVVTLGTLTIYRGATFVLSGGAWVNADQMSPDFIGFQRAAAPRHSRAVLDRHRWSIAAVLRADDAHAARPLDLCHRRQSDCLRLCRHRCRPHQVHRLLHLRRWSPASAGYLWVSRYVIASVEVANGYELNIIAACVIGGISIAGGIGSVGGAVLGALFLGIINDGAAGDQHLALLADGDLGQRHHPRRRAQRARRAQAGPHHPEESGGRMSARPDDQRRPPHPRPARQAASLGASDQLGGAADRRGGRDLRRSTASPRPISSTPWSLSDLTFNFTEKALIALAMALLIISGEIDLSVAAIIALASTLMGMALQAGAGTPVLVVDRHCRRACLRRLQRRCWSPGSACRRSWSPSAR